MESVAPPDQHAKQGKTGIGKRIPAPTARGRRGKLIGKYSNGRQETDPFGPDGDTGPQTLTAADEQSGRTRANAYALKADPASARMVAAALAVAPGAALGLAAATEEPAPEA